MKKIFFILVMLMVPAAAYAQSPTISGVTGTFEHDAALVISGSNFGTKTQGAPYVWDDFETGPDGDNLIGWTLYVAGGSPNEYPHYENDVVRQGVSTLSGAMGTPGQQYDSCAWIDALGSLDQAYAHLYCYVANENDWTTSASTNIKMMRLTAGHDAVHGGWPNLGSTGNQNLASSFFNTFYNFRDEGSPTLDYAAVTMYTWHKWEYYLKCSDPAGTANGIATVWIDGVKVMDETNIVTMSVTASNDGEDPPTYYKIDRWLLPFFVGNPDSTDYTIYYDDAYLDDTLARVEMGDNADYASCTLRELQIPTAWGASEISVTANQGAFTEEMEIYLYVIDANGTVSAGYEMAMAGTPVVMGSCADMVVITCVE